MDPFSQAASRFSARRAAFWKVRRLSVLRAVAASGHRSDLVDALRWEEAQPACRRPLFTIVEPFTTERGHAEAAMNHLLEECESIRAAAAAAGVTLAALERPVSPEPVVALVSTARLVAAALPAELEGIAVVLCPSEAPPASEWAAYVKRLLQAAAALSGAPASGREAAVQWIVHDTPGGPLAAALGEGVDFELDDGAMFAWWRSVGQKGRRETAPAASSDAGPAQGVLSPPAATALREHLATGAEALARNDPDHAIVAFHAARTICATEKLPAYEAALWMAIAGAQLAASATEDALASYRIAAALAQGASAPSLACQARLGEAGVLLVEKRHGDAAPVYLEAAGLAESAGSTALRGEALRMAGLCHEPSGRAGEPGPIAPSPDAIAAERVAVAPISEVPEDRDPTLAAPILMPRRALPFVPGNVDPDWLDAMVTAAESRRDSRRRPSGMETVLLTGETQPHPEGRGLPFEDSSREATYSTQPLTVAPPAKPLPFVVGTVDPALFDRAAIETEDTLDAENDAGDGCTGAPLVDPARARGPR